MPDRTLEIIITRVAQLDQFKRVITAQPCPVVLVGHACGGVVNRGRADLVVTIGHGAFIVLQPFHFIFM